MERTFHLLYVAVSWAGGKPNARVLQRQPAPLEGRTLEDRGLVAVSDGLAARRQARRSRTT